ncbi:hypothetical protein GCM10011491_08110 [Brucella endophytica]|uniref:Uncharacterized protein n=1 Tax=Brucella endophytica TaxID=1963359 RepID=A0A916WB43_9HYPH|nr:hypothetical protein [Brucella endophytica]GGA83052.1 hypothetical protein GCM10011491_08110 [Brucella endophytica]
MAEEPSRKDKLVFIAGELRELLQIARSENLTMLVYFIDMARIEAENNLNDV